MGRISRQCDGLSDYQWAVAIHRPRDFPHPSGGARLSLGKLRGWLPDRLNDAQPLGGVRIARLLIGATVIWYGLLLVFAHVKTMPLAMVCLMLAGIAQSMSMISIAVILMRSASERFRGRVMGVRMMVIYGLPFGLLAAGSLIDLVGFSATATLYAASGLALMTAIALRWREDLWPVHAPS